MPPKKNKKKSARAATIDETTTKSKSTPRAESHQDAPTMASQKKDKDEFPLLKLEGRYVQTTSGYGNCLFNSLSDQLYGHEGEHMVLRDRICNYILEHKDFFIHYVTAKRSDETRSVPKRKAALRKMPDCTLPSEEEIERAFYHAMEKMRQYGTCGGHPEITAFMRIFNAIVYVHTRDGVIINRADGQEEVQPADKRLLVHIAFHSGAEHYSSVRNTDGPHEGLLNVRLGSTISQTLSHPEDIVEDAGVRTVGGSDLERSHLPSPAPSQPEKDLRSQADVGIPSTSEETRCSPPIYQPKRLLDAPEDDWNITVNEAVVAANRASIPSPPPGSPPRRSNPFTDDTSSDEIRLKSPTKRRSPDADESHPYPGSSEESTVEEPIALRLESKNKRRKSPDGSAVPTEDSSSENSSGSNTTSTPKTSVRSRRPKATNTAAVETDPKPTARRSLRVRNELCYAEKSEDEDEDEDGVPRRVARPRNHPRKTAKSTKPPPKRRSNSKDNREEIGITKTTTMTIREHIH